MTNDEMNRIKETYEHLLEIKNEILQLEKSVKEYEQSPIVQKYLKLKNQLENDKRYSYDQVQNKTNEDILEKAIDSIRVTHPENIYVYIGTYQRSHEIDIEHGSTDYRVSISDPNADYREYRNIELSRFEATIQVPISMCEKFENENIVLFPYKQANVNAEYYYKIRNMYFETAIKYGKEKALEKVLYQRNKKK